MSSLTVTVQFRCSQLILHATQVMKGREEQIQGKMDEVRRQQEESLERRGQLLQEMELVDQVTRREQQETEARKAAQKQQLEAQLSYVPIIIMTRFFIALSDCCH